MLKSSTIVEDKWKMQIIIHFKKKGLLRFLSAIEISNSILRLLQRSNLPMEYSKGFHPTPKVSFLDLTPTGMIDLAMYVSVQLRQTEGIDKRDLLKSLKKNAPNGIEPINIFNSELNLNKVVTRYEYVIFSKEPLDLSKSVSKHSGKLFIPKEFMNSINVVLHNRIYMIKYTVDKQNLFNPYLIDGVFLAVRKKAFIEDVDVSNKLGGQE